MSEEAPDGTWRPDELETVARCPMCASEAREVLYRALTDRELVTRGQWTVHACASCGSAYLDPRPRADVIGRAYERYYTHAPVASAPRGPFGRLRLRICHGCVNETRGYRLEPRFPLARLVTAPFPGRRRVAQLTVRDLPHPGGRGRLLDVGAGSGDFVGEMAAAGWDAEGVDPDPAAVRLARMRGLVVHEGTLDDLRADAAGRYDAVTFNHVLEHLPEPTETLDRVARLLNPGGRLWVRLPNIESRGHGRYGPDWIGLDPPRHLVLPTAHALRSAVERAGFEAELLPAPGSAWWFEESAKLRNARLGRRTTPADRARTKLVATISDLVTHRRLAARDELIVSAKRR